tara:strand:- start:491 stop:1330 length:840 start_codon:yes stop_codon:yes gene_type:complete
MSRHSNSPPPSDGGDGHEDDPPVETPAPTLAEADGSSGKKKLDNRNFVLAFGKEFYTVPRECVEFDAGRPVSTANGLEAFKLHDSKSFPLWTGANISERHMIKLVVTNGGERQVGWYMTFKVGGHESDDVCILRAVHKTIAEKLYNMWTGKDVPAERKDKYSSLLSEKPSFVAQINPKNRWVELKEAPDNVLYSRPKKEPVKSSKREREDDDDATSSATTNKGALALAPQHNKHNKHNNQEAEPVQPGFGSGAQIFMQTPGCVTISESYLRFLIENQQR